MSFRETLLHNGFVDRRRINAGAEALDRRVPELREPRPGSLFANFHVAAVA